MKDYTYKPVKFFLIATLITWISWFWAAGLSYSNTGKLFAALELIGMFGPVVAGIWMIFASGSRELKRNFYQRLLNLKLVKPSTIFWILVIMPVAVVVSVLLSRLFFGEPLEQLKFAKLAAVGIIPLPVMFFGAALMEELGWKGYGVDSLRGKRSFFSATLIFALLWVLWHIPLFFINNYYHNTLIKTNPLFALNFAVSVIPAAFIINWLWYRSRGSILVAALFHATANFQGILEMGQVAKCIQTVVLIIIAAVIVSLNKKIFFKEFTAQIGYFGE